MQQKADGQRYVYSPTVSPQRAKRSALQRLLSTFFAGSAEAAMVALIDLQSSRLSDEEFARLEEMLRAARAREGEQKTD